MKSYPDCKTWVVGYAVCKKKLVFVHTRFTKDLESQSLLLNILHGVKWNKWNPAIYPVVMREGLETTGKKHCAIMFTLKVVTIPTAEYLLMKLMKSCISVIIKARCPISWTTPSKILNECMSGESTLLMIPSKWFWNTLMLKNNWPKGGGAKTSHKRTDPKDKQLWGKGRKISK